MLENTDRSFVARTFNRSRKPLLIWLAPPVLAFYGITGGLFAIVVISDGWQSPHLTWGFSVSSNIPATAVALPMLGGLSCVCCAGAYGFFRERSWARPVVAYGLLAFNVAAIATILTLSRSVRLDLASADWASAAFAGLVYFYLYHYPAAVAYYQRLREQQAGNPAPAS